MVEVLEEEVQTQEAELEPVEALQAVPRAEEANSNWVSRCHSWEAGEFPGP
jgi:hypothetical protein